MALLNESIRQELETRLTTLSNPVRLINFTQTLECQFCGETRSLLEEVASTSDKITLDVYNFQTDKEQVSKYAIDKIPATVVEGDRDYGIRFYGIPSGYEFSALIDAIERVSERDSGLDDETREKLAALSDPVYIQVFVTPT
jgi:glutaredoxin-like protein